MSRNDSRFEEAYRDRGFDAGRNRHRPETLTAADLMTLDLPSVKQVVEDILSEGVTLFAGKPKMGKSWMMLALALAVPHGGMVLGEKPVQQGEALYLALEDNRRRLQGRMEKLLADRKAPAGLHLAFDWPRLDEGGTDELNTFLEEHPKTRLVIVDTLARFKPQGPSRRTHYDEDRDAVDSLIPLADKHGVAIVLVHHLREKESEDPLDMITGSVGLTGGVDGALVLKRQRGKADAYLYGDGRDLENPIELALKWDAGSTTWAIAGGAEEYRLSEERRAILSVLENADEPLGPKEITEAINAKGMKMKDGSVREILSKMVKDGQAKNLGRGAYVHPNYQELP